MHIDDLLRLAVKKSASDLHIKVSNFPILRIDGELVPQDIYPKVTTEWIEKSLKEIVDEKQLKSFREILELDYSYKISGLAYFRLNLSMQYRTVSMVFRLVNWDIPSIDALGLPIICKDLMLKPRGLIIVTGPTGSGKSTTLAAMIDHLNRHERKRIVTIEDPIEYIFRDRTCVITQRELGIDTHSFSSALIHALRQDPDVIMVGEMRDLETIHAALTGAETGHLVLATLHTPSAPEAIDRIIDVFPPHQQHQIRLQLSQTLEGVLYQLLLKRRKGKGRVPAVEVMIATTAIRNMIRQNKTHQMLSVMETGISSGMKSLNQAMARLIKDNMITYKEALLQSSDPKTLKRLMGGSSK